METNIALRKELSIKFHTACKEIFHLTAHDWQAGVGLAILEAVELKKNIKMLCVRPTGGGKSLIFNVVATTILTSEGVRERLLGVGSVSYRLFRISGMFMLQLCSTILAELHLMCWRASTWFWASTKSFC